jgi:hypothetical protein
MEDLKISIQKSFSPNEKKVKSVYTLPTAVALARAKKRVFSLE